MEGVTRLLCPDCGQPLVFDPDRDLDFNEGRREPVPACWREDMASALLVEEDGREMVVGWAVVCQRCDAEYEPEALKVALERTLHAAYRQEAPVREPLTSGSDTLDEWIASTTAVVRGEHPEFTYEVARLWAIEVIKEIAKQEASGA